MGKRRRERRNLPRRARVQRQRSAGLARRRRMDAAWAGVAGAGPDRGEAGERPALDQARDNLRYRWVVPLDALYRGGQAESGNPRITSVIASPRAEPLGLGFGDPPWGGTR